MTGGTRWTPARALALGALTVGVLDGLDAVVFFGLRGVGPIRIFQSIAAGVLGRAAFQGGLPAAALGVVLHFTVATGIVTVYHLASRLLPLLRMRPIVCGALYGVAAYLVMTFIVVPLSAAVTGSRPLPVIVNGILIHMFGVGPPAALSARLANPSRSRAR
jgi:hypothetical protein